MYWLALFVSLVVAVKGDSCSSHHLLGHAGIGCFDEGCCQSHSVVSNLCPGPNNIKCCFTKNTCSGTNNAVQLSGCPHIVTRSQWGAAHSAHALSTLSATPRYVFIHHTESPACSTESACSRSVRGIQNFHIHSRGWNDIGYSFLIGGDGNAYEGRGWDKVGAHTKGYNSVGLAFSMIGNFDHTLPDTRALNTVKQMIACGVSHGKISSSYHLLGHRDVNPTDCPGQDLYNLIRTWPHYGKP